MMDEHEKLHMLAEEGSRQMSELTGKSLMPVAAYPARAWTT